ncbi:MAG TPA: CbiX/SirB N-terminal domain-containing protein, partial [Pirellulaceae bacterium]|nr:CbiX/SirB N-terminal domain-containing protein [Pirellulaceae bacterium]
MLSVAPAGRGLLVVGHGTRSEQGCAEFLETVQCVAQRLPQVAVQAAFLELAEPTIGAALAQLAARGVRRVVVMPLLLFAAGHAKQDIPQAVAEAAREHPQLQIQLTAHLGCHERLLALSALRFEEAIDDESGASPQETLWLMVGRGSREPSAWAEMERFVALRQRFTPVAQARIAYLSMAEPSFAQLLPAIAELRFRRVVVQPHLLFHGELLVTVGESVAIMAKKW